MYTDHALNSPARGETSARSNLTLSYDPWSDFVVSAATASIRTVLGGPRDSRQGRGQFGVSFSLVFSKGWMGILGGGAARCDIDEAILRG